MEVKTCTKCQLEKVVTDFNKLTRSKDGLAWMCRDCQSAEKRNYYLRNRDTFEFKNKRRMTAYTTRYGISYFDKRRILATQGGCCASCGVTLLNEGHLDHDHETGAIRGVLCQGCNQALGQVGDSIERLESLIDYLRADRKITFLPEVTI